MIHYLWSHKVGSVARGHKEAVFSPELFCKAEITDPYRFWVTRLIHVQDIARLQVSMYNLGMDNYETTSKQWMICKTNSLQRNSGHAARFTQNL